MAKVKLQESVWNKKKKIRYHITIPSEYVADKKWKKGQQLMLVYNKDGDIVIKEMPKNNKQP